MIGATILLVEDNEALRQGIQLILQTDGYTVLAAGNGLEALRIMQFTIPDLILSDIVMPMMDGYALFEAVRARPEWITIPIIFLTAHGGREDQFRSRTLGAEDFLVKPVNRHELLATIRSRLLRNQQLLLVRLQQAYEMSLIMLSNAIELRDHYTRGHVERVMDISVTIAQRMGCSVPQISAIQFGSILHDIGKIHIQERVLRKAGPLNGDEWSEMKRHPEIGVELVKNIPFLAPAIPIIRHHHERWDGQGYPDGLSGPAIPLLARIVAVADSLDAMTSARIYQETSSLEGAYQEILNGSGSQYDPQVVEAFRSAWDEIRSRVIRVEN
jgi:putative two-component system response regulator